MAIVLRRERPEEYRTVEEITREAFWGTFRPDCDEHYLLHTMRNNPQFVPELDYVAEEDGRIVGNIVYVRTKIVGEDGAETEVLTFGPLSVLPAWQKKGIGRALMERTFAEARNLGYRAVLIFGHPDYYPKMGFAPAKKYFIKTADGQNFDAFMALPLYEGALDGLRGRFYPGSVYDIDQAKAAEFDRTFPPKEALPPQSIEALLAILPKETAEAIAKRAYKTINDILGQSGREVALWEGMDEKSCEALNAALRALGYPEKTFAKKA